MLRNRLPRTALFTSGGLLNSLQTEPVIYVKPVVGSGGQGIIRIKRVANQYLVQYGLTKILITNKEKLLQTMRRITMGRPYLIQEGIKLLSIQERPVDFRLLLLRPGSKWLMAGIMGKWAAPGKIVTNHAKGGRPITLQKALRTSLGLSAADCKVIEKRMKLIGYHITQTLGTPHGLREMGIDLGIDKQLNIWIFEVNTTPQFNLFKYHQDKSLYSKVARTISMIRRNNTKRPPL